MKASGVNNKVLIFFSFLLIITALLLFWLHISRPGAEPGIATKEFMHAVSVSDLKSMRLGSSSACYDNFVQYFGKRKFESVQNIYKLMYRYGLPIWSDYRRKAEMMAQREYELLRDRIIALGRIKFQQLSLEERMQLMNDRAKFDAFILQAGIEGLSAEDKNKIDNIKEFSSPEGRNRFIERGIFYILPEEDQKVLGSSAALSKSDTPEKLAFIDRSAMSFLSESQKKEISVIPRSELNNPPLFMSKFGEPLAKAFLENLQLQWSLSSKPCSFPAQDMKGSLLRGSEAVCSLNIFSKKSQKENAENIKTLRLILQKEGFRWIVMEINPNLYELYEEGR